jgi:hypothetical protein
MELRLTVAELIRHFDFSVPPELLTDMTPIQRFICRPKDNKYLVKVDRID